MEQEYYSQEKEHALREFEASHEKLYTRGKTIVFTIALLNVVSAVISSVIDFSLLQLAVQIALSIALFRGVSWVKYFFIIGAGLSCCISVSLLLKNETYWIASLNQTIGILLIAYLVLNLCYSIIVAILLFKSRAVSEFLYAQKNG